MNKANRRLRERFLQFRLRALLFIPVLIAIYFAVGAYTRTAGVQDVSDRLTRENGGHIVNARYFAPLLVEFRILEVRCPPGKPDVFIAKSDYYLWMFGFTAKLPYHSVVESDHET
ncbi:MAG: hypothetical protein U0905_12180 [Pirellulales bacterium]